MNTQLSILLAGALIAGAIIYTGGGAGTVIDARPSDGGGLENRNSARAENVLPVDESDHWRGAANARVTIIEYSDLQCSFCARFHSTMKRIVEQYPDDVRWVYRHFPLDSIHPQARPAAVASECIATLAGATAFWDFVDTIFDERPTLSPAYYAASAEAYGITSDDFERCLASGGATEKVARDSENAIASGGQGTPFNIIVTDTDQVFPFAGALPIEQVESLVEQALGVAGGQ
jgi:protein-disulfide isomerase